MGGSNKFIFKTQPACNYPLASGHSYLMFSYFTGGISNCTPEKKITIERLVKLIKENNNQTIRQIRTLDNATADYRERKNALKKTLPYITPNCTVTSRNDKSIKEFSGYMYFDIDNCNDAQAEKKKLVDLYPNQISMACLSSSAKGLSFFVKIENEITMSNFRSIRKYLCEVVFNDLAIDPNTSAISNAWYVSYDKDCLYNPSAVIEIPEAYITLEHKGTKSAKGTIIYPPTDIVSFAPSSFSTVDINEVIRGLKFRTEVQVQNKLFDVYPVEYCEVVFAGNYKIPDGKKRNVIAQVIHNLIYLNPAVDKSYILSYLIWLNKFKTVTPANWNDVIRWFSSVEQKIRETGELKPKIKTKYFHCKKNCIHPNIREKLARRLANIYRSNETIKKICQAKQIILLQKSANSTIIYPSPDIVSFAPSIKATQAEVHNLIKEVATRNGVKAIGIRTIKKYWNSEPLDMDTFVKNENEMFVMEIKKQND